MRSPPRTPASRSTRAGSPTTRLPEVRQPGRAVQPRRARRAVILPTGANANPAFGVGASGTWASIPERPESDGQRLPSRCQFRYEVDNSDYQDKGILHLRSTGTGRRRDPLDRRRPQAGRVHRLPLLHQLRDRRTPRYSAQPGGAARPSASAYAYAIPARARRTERLPARSSSRESTFSTARCAATTGMLHLRVDVREGRHHVEHHDADLTNGVRLQRPDFQVGTAELRSRRSTCRRPTPR